MKRRMNRDANRQRLSVRAGGAKGDRTLDLRLAKPALSQLSYDPDTTRKGWGGPDKTRTCDLTLIRGAL
jgi:hypothetical protein